MRFNISNYVMVSDEIATPRAYDTVVCILDCVPGRRFLESSGQGRRSCATRSVSYAKCLWTREEPRVSSHDQVSVFSLSGE